MNMGVSVFMGHHLKHYDKKDEKSIGAVYATCNTPEGLLFSSSAGLFQFNHDKPGNAPQELNINIGADETLISAICYINENQVAFGTFESGIVIYKNNQPYSFNVNNGLTSNSISCIYNDSKNRLWIGTSAGITIKDNDLFYKIRGKDGLVNEEVQTICEDREGNIWIGTLNGLVQLNGENYRDFDEEEGLLDKKIYSIEVDNNDNIIIGTYGGGLYLLDKEKERLGQPKFISPIGHSAIESQNIYALKLISDSILIVGTDKGFYQATLAHNDTNCIKQVSNYSLSNGLENQEIAQNSISSDTNQSVWLGTSDGILNYAAQAKGQVETNPLIYINNIQLKYNNVNWTEKGCQPITWNNFPSLNKLRHKENTLQFTLNGVWLSNNANLKYRYYLKGIEKGWNPYSPNRVITYHNLPHGKYVLHAQAQAGSNKISDIVKYKFTIKPPFWKTLWFAILGASVFIVIVLTYIKYRERRLIKEKKNLEQTVHERTHEIVLQKNHIEAQAKEISQSINYARRLQEAIMVAPAEIKKQLPDSFTLYMPKDVVSGDFYWFADNSRYTIIAAVDCTGHGVPGAFVSILGNSNLNRIIDANSQLNAADILAQLDLLTIDSLKKREGGSVEDGMDMALCVIDKQKNELQYAGALNPLVYIEDNKLHQVKADKYPIGGTFFKEKKFTQHTFDLSNKQRCFYIFSDGFQDQFGGPNDKKFLSRRFLDLLLSIHQEPFDEQKHILKEKHNEWKLDEEQTDDILVIGFKL